MPNYGINVLRSDGVAIASQSMPGGRIFLQKIDRAVETAGTVTAYTYSLVPGGTYLRVVQVGRGAHSWATGTDGSGNATLTLTANANDGSQPNTTLYVFATKTTEPNYGILMVNDAGERTVSSVYPCAEFLGKFTFSSTPDLSSNIAAIGGSAYTEYTHYSTASTLGSGRERLVLWSLPSTANDVWFVGDNFIPATVTTSYQLAAKIYRAPATSWTMPEAFVFALTGMSASSGNYGMRVYNASGGLMFDAGLSHMIVKGYETTLGYPSTGTSTITASSFTGITPAISIPDYEVWQGAPNGTSTSLVSDWRGVVRRNGTTLYGKRVCLESATGPRLTYTYDEGLYASLTQLVVSATDFGGTAFS
jgi:hypothetical protein